MKKIIKKACSVFRYGREVLNNIWSVFRYGREVLNYIWSVFRYGREVLNYIWSVKHVGEDGKYLTHDPMCELFPTEVKKYTLSKVDNICKI